MERLSLRQIKQLEQFTASVSVSSPCEAGVRRGDVGSISEFPCNSKFPKEKISVSVSLCVYPFPPPISPSSSCYSRTTSEIQK